MRSSLPLLISLSLSLFVPVQAQPRDELSYSLGVRLGERLRDEVPALQVDDLLRGLQQAYRGAPLELPAARIEAVLDAHEAHLAADGSADLAAQRAEQRFLASERARPGTRAFANGVLWRELQPGRGERPKSGQQVRVRYRGYLADGSLFDQSAEPQWFALDSLIEGWRTALLQMRAGARWQLVIPSALGYGSQGAGELIPAHAPLLFEVELLESR